MSGRLHWDTIIDARLIDGERFHELHQEARAHFRGALDDRGHKHHRLAWGLVSGVFGHAHAMRLLAFHLLVELKRATRTHPNAEFYVRQGEAALDATRPVAGWDEESERRCRVRSHAPAGRGAPKAGLCCEREEGHTEPDAHVFDQKARDHDGTWIHVPSAMAPYHFHDQPEAP